MIFVIGVTSSFVVGFYLLRVYFKEFNKSLVASAVLSILVGVFIEIYIENFQTDHLDDADDVKHTAGVPIVLWWTAFSRKRDEIRKCVHTRCFFTENRSFLHFPEAKAFLFYGSDLNITDLPVPRSQEIWALLHEESLKNAPVLLSERFISLFNFTSTFDRDSDLPLTTLHLRNLDAITDTKYFVPTTTKNKLLEEIAPVVYIQSSCDTLVDRDAYVANLSQYIKIDSFGRCLNNAQLPENLNTLTSLSSDEFLTFLSRYKFTIAIENAACHDYITEKLWRPLIVGSVPLYFGSTSIHDWLPNNSSVIFIEDFRSPQDLANYIVELNNRDDFYNLFLQHKTEAKIDNEKLENIMKSRLWNEYDSLIEKFECDVCLALHVGLSDERLKKYNNHLKCKTPTSMLTNEKSHFWNAVLNEERCRGHVVHDFITKNMTLNVNAVEEEVQLSMKNHKC